MDFLTTANVQPTEPRFLSKSDTRTFSHHQTVRNLRQFQDYQLMSGTVQWIQYEKTS